MSKNVDFVLGAISDKLLIFLKANYSKWPIYASL